MRNALFFLMSLLSLSQVVAQTSFVFSLNDQINTGTNVLDRAFEGGFRNPQFQNFDMNFDGQEDLVVFDRAARKVFTFLRQEGNYVYSPSFERYFPKEINHWVSFADVDCDGRKDLFTSSLFGMSLFRNTSEGGSISWELWYETVFTEGSNGQINLQVSSGDYPAITDVDGDGDIDILVFDFASGGGVHHHQNLSMENNGTCGLELVRVTRKYGDFEECTCETYAFNDEVCPEGGRLQHSGGKSVLSFDFAENGVQDLMIGQEYCTLSGFLMNEGSIQQPDFNSVSFDFPSPSNPVQLEFPAYFMVDVDGDGDNDLIAAPNTLENNVSQDFSQSGWLYLNESGNYALSTKGFLQEEMLDVGNGAKPALSDIDSDGDQDLLVANSAHSAGAHLELYLNQGTVTAPQFELSDSDFLALSQFSLLDLNIQTRDLDNDGLDELIILEDEGSIEASIYWHTGNILNPYNEDRRDNLVLPSVKPGDQIVLEDVESDGVFELFIGRTEGNLSYFKNLGSLLNPDWSLISDNYLELAEDFNARNLHLTFDDFDGDGLRDALLYSDAQKLFIVYSYVNNVDRAEMLMYDSINNVAYDHSFGNRAYPVSGNLHGGLPSALIGMYSGGFNLLRNVNSGGEAGEVPIRVTLYPNPINAQSNLKVIANQNVTASIFDTKGNLITEDLKIDKLSEKEFNFSYLRQGIYVIRFKNQVGQAISRSIVVTK